MEETRRGFYAGANHLFSSIMSILEPDAEPTAKDLAQMQAIHDEIKEYGEELLRKYATQKKS